MEDINYFKDKLLSIHDFRKIVLLIFIIKRDDTLLTEMGLSNVFITKLYKKCEKIFKLEMEDYESHIKNLEESILEELNKY